MESALPTTSSTLSCPTCDAGLAVPADVMLGEILGCDDCGVELEITALDPLGVAEAPEVAEDWGE